MRLFNLYAIPAAMLIASYLLLSTGWRLYDLQDLHQTAAYLVYAGYLCAAAGLVLALRGMWMNWWAYRRGGIAAR